MVQFNTNFNPLKQAIIENGVNGQPRTKEQANALGNVSIYFQQNKPQQTTETTGDKAKSNESLSQTLSGLDKGVKTQEAPQKNTKTIDKGDTLWRIAKKELGRGATNSQIANYVNKIIKANPQIKNPNVIMAGTEITLPLTVDIPKEVTDSTKPLTKENITPEKVMEDLRTAREFNPKLNTSAAEHLEAPKISDAAIRLQQENDLNTSSKSEQPSPIEQYDYTNPKNIYNPLLNDGGFRA